MNPVTTNASPRPAYEHPGRTDFDVGDRLAILNLVSSYSEYYDLDDFDRWFELFTDDVTCTVNMGNAPAVTVSGAEFREFLNSYRHDVCAANSIAPRHFISNLSVKKQSANLAEIVAYICYVPVDERTMHTPESKQHLRLTGTARYRFVTVKGAVDGIWRIREYFIVYDQTEV